MSILVLVVIATLVEYTVQGAINGKNLFEDYLKDERSFYKDFYPIAIYMSASKKTDNNTKLLLKHKMAGVPKHKSSKGTNHKKMNATDKKLIRNQKLRLGAILGALGVGWELYNSYTGK